MTSPLTVDPADLETTARQILDLAAQVLLDAGLNPPDEASRYLAHGPAIAFPGRETLSVSVLRAATGTAGAEVRTAPRCFAPTTITCQVVLWRCVPAVDGDGLAEPAARDASAAALLADGWALLRAFQASTGSRGALGTMSAAGPLEAIGASGGMAGWRLTVTVPPVTTVPAAPDGNGG